MIDEAESNYQTFLHETFRVPWPEAGEKTNIPGGAEGRANVDVKALSELLSRDEKGA